VATSNDRSFRERSKVLADRSGTLGLLAFTILLLPAINIETVQAEVRVVTAQGEHRMGDRDTKEEAIRLATESAKRNALEQVATYLESITVVTDLNVTKDEIRSYTAGVVLVQEQLTSTTLDGDTVVIRVDIAAEIDTDEVAKAIAALRENEDARQQLVALQQENDRLQQELDAANVALTNAGTAEQVQQANQQRNEILNRVQSNSMVAQAWTDWVIVAPVVSPFPWVGLAQVQGLLNVAGRLNPSSPHVQVAQSVISTKPAPTPPTPPAPPVAATPSMPRHTIVPGPGSLPSSPIAGATPPRQEATSQSGPAQGRGLSRLYQANPSIQNLMQQGSLPQTSPSPNGMQRPIPSPGQGANSTLQPYVPGQQVPSHSRMGQGSMPRRLPPTINQIHPPTPHQVPRVPFSVAPSAPRGGNVGGGGGRGGGGGGGRVGGGGGKR
jgi:hypothetical protein